MAVEVAAKAAVGAPDDLGDCPFTQRVLFTLEEKKVPYKLHLINFDDKAQWFTEVNPEGKVPMVKFDDKWVCDSDVLVEIIEEKYPEPCLKTPPEFASVGLKIFVSFETFLKSEDPSDGSEQTMLNELKALDDHLKEHGPYIAGEKITDADLILAPKLYLIKKALDQYKKWPAAAYVHMDIYAGFLFSRKDYRKYITKREHLLGGSEPKVDPKINPETQIYQF